MTSDFDFTLGVMSDHPLGLPYEIPVPDLGGMAGPVGEETAKPNLPTQRTSMKAFLALTFLSATAQAAPLPNPPGSAVTMPCGQPLVTAVVTGFSADGQYVLGQVSAHTSCSAGGRGSRPKAYSDCYPISWPVADPAAWEIAYDYPCAAVDATAVYAFGPFKAWTMAGVGQLQ